MCVTFMTDVESAPLSTGQNSGMTSTAPAVVRRAGTLLGLTGGPGPTCTTVLHQNL